MKATRRALLALIILGMASQVFAMVPRTVFSELGSATW
jgi:hypothetical protein